MSNDVKTPPWEKYDVSRTEWENMTPDERRKVRYDHWYEKNRERRNKRRREKYHNDPDHRKKVLDGCKRRRPRLRREKAQEKFEAKLQEARERELEQSEETDYGGGRKGLPRFVSVAGQEMWVYTSRKLAVECGRGKSTIRAWLAHEVLPGCTIVIKGRYYFSTAFIKAIRRACKRVYLIDGNGSRDVLAELIREELAKAGCSYVPPDGTENDRVYPQAA